MTQDSRLDRHEIYAAAAAVAAQFNAGQDGFRQRDLKFLIELFSNWSMGTLDAPVIRLQNTQILRYLEAITADGLARKFIRKGRPKYRLTRTGLLELVSRCVNNSPFGHSEQFFFIYYFISSYRAKVETMVKAEGRMFPSALKIELNELLDERALLRREIAAAEKILRFYDERISDTRKASSWTASRLREGLLFPEAAAEVEKLFPYQLNSQKPLTELLASIPQEQQPWELVEGGERRVACIFQPVRLLQRSYLQALRDLQCAENEI